MDLIAAVLDKIASGGDLIVLQSVWDGITFDRYYHGQARWVTVPPIDSHKVHRTDLVLGKLSQRDPMAPVLSEMTNVLRSGNSVWVVGRVTDADPKRLLPPPPPPGQPIKWWVSYLNYWDAQVTAQLRGHALQQRVIEMPVNGPVNCLENLPVLRFSGYKSNAD